jgi:nitrogen fixation protein
MPRPISDPIVGTVRSSPLSAMDNYLNDLHALTQVRKSHLARLYCLLTNAWDADMPDLPDVPIPNSGNKMGSLMGLIEYNRNLEKETEDAISRLETTL